MWVQTRRMKSFGTTLTERGNTTVVSVRRCHLDPIGYPGQGATTAVWRNAVARGGDLWGSSRPKAEIATGGFTAGKRSLSRATDGRLQSEGASKLLDVGCNGRL